MAKISKDALICFIKDVIKENGKEPKDIYFERSNGGYHGIITKGEDDDSPNISCSPVINVDYLYDEYCGDNMTIGDILGYVNHVLTVDVGVNGNNLINEMMDWNKAKNKLFISVCSIAGNGAYLAGVVHEKHDDMAIVPRIFAFDDKQRGFGSSPIMKTILDAWKVSESDVMETAKRNSPNMFPMKLFDFHTALFDVFAAERGLPPYVSVNDGDVKEIVDKMLGVRYILSTYASHYGAAAMFYDGVLDDIYKNISREYESGVFYIMPMSTHQCLIIPARLMNTDILGYHMKLTGVANHLNLVFGHNEPNDSVDMSLYRYDGESLTYAKRSL